MEYHSLTEHDLLAYLKARKNGLSEDEAAGRLRMFGYNIVEERRKKQYLREYARQFTQLFAVLLEIAAVLSFIAHACSPDEGYEILGVAILSAVIINASFAFWQEYKAERKVKALRKLMPRQVSVRRVPGSDPAERVLDARNVVFAGTTVVSGNGIAAVYETGMATEFGKIAVLTGEGELPPRLRRGTSRLFVKRFITYILASNMPEIIPFILHFFLIPLPLTRS